MTDYIELEMHIEVSDQDDTCDNYDGPTNDECLGGPSDLTLLTWYVYHVVFKL